MIIEKLNESINKCNLKIQKLEAIRKVAQKYDGKVFNKRFVALLETVPDIYADISIKQGISKHHTLDIWVKSLDYEHNSLLHRYICEDAFLQDGRLNFKAFSEYIDNRQKELTEDIEKLQFDIDTGEERLKRYNELVCELDKLKLSFSTDFKQFRRHDFERFVTHVV